MDADAVVRSVRGVYDSYAPEWAAATQDRTAWQPAYAGFAGHVPRGSVVLDIGCGPGLNAPGLARAGLQQVGIDFSPVFADMASEQPGLRGRVFVADLRYLPFRDASFDAVWATGVYHHIPKAALPGALGEAWRVLRPGGVFYASVEVEDDSADPDDRHGEGEVLFDELPVPRFYALYHPVEWLDYLERAGFDWLDEYLAEGSGRSFGWIATTSRKG